MEEEKQKREETETKEEIILLWKSSIIMHEQCRHMSPPTAKAVH